MRKRELLSGLGVLALFMVPGQAQAQGGGGGGIPGGLDPNMIKQRVKDALPRVLEAAPSETIEIEGLVKLTYKKVPTNPQKIGEALGQDLGGAGGGGIPAGIDINQYMGMFENDIAEILNSFLEDFGTLEVKKELKVKSKTIPIGEHKVGLVFEGERPVALRIFNEDKEKLEKPIDIRLKTRSVDLQDELKIELKEPKKQKEGKEKFEIVLSFLRFAAKSKTQPQVAGDE